MILHNDIACHWIQRFFSILETNKEIKQINFVVQTPSTILYWAKCLCNEGNTFCMDFFGIRQQFVDFLKKIDCFGLN